MAITQDTNFEQKCCICMEEGKIQHKCKICKSCLLCAECKNQLISQNLFSNCPTCRQKNWIDNLKENENVNNCFRNIKSFKIYELFVTFCQHLIATLYGLSVLFCLGLVATIILNKEIVYNEVGILLILLLGLFTLIFILLGTFLLIVFTAIVYCLFYERK